MLRILHVDDSQEDLELTKMQLRRQRDDLDIDWALSAQEALKAIENKKYDCVLSDYQMPGMDGLEFLTALRDHGDDIPFIFLTGQGNEDVAAEALRVGSDDYYTKEVGFAHYQRLLNSIRRVVEARNRRIKQREAERALEESEEKYRTLVVRANDLIVIVQDELLKYANPQIGELVGHNLEEALDTPFVNYLHPDEIPKVVDNYRRRMAGEDIPNVYESALRHRDGRRIDVELNVSRIEYRGKPAALVFIRDITDRKKTEEALRESEERFRSLFENATIGLYRTTPDGKVLLANPSLVTMLGFAGFEDLAGRNLEAEGFESSYPRALFKDRIEAEGVVTGLESSWKRKDGSIIFVRESAAAVRDSEGKTLYYEGTVEDITERKRAEQELIRARKDWEGIFQAIGHPALILNSKHKILEANRAAVSALGLSEQEIKGKDCFEILHASEKPPACCPFERMLETAGLETFVMEMEALGGTYLVSCTPVLDEQGKLQKVIHIATNIARRKEAEKALRESEERFKAAFDHAAIGRAIASLDGRFIKVNRSLCEITGYTEEELLKKTWMEMCHPAHYEENLKNFRKLMEGEFPSYHMELKARHKDGKDPWIHLNVVLIRDLQEKPLYMVGDMVDITELKEAESALRNSGDRLERHARELKAVNEELRAFSYSVSHDLKSPLQHIEGFARILSEDHADSLGSEGKQFLGRIRSGIERMSNLIHGLMKLSKLTQVELKPKEVDLSEIALSIAEALKESAPDRVVKFSIAAEIKAKGDVQLLRLVIENLLGNAFKFTARRKKALIAFGVNEVDGRETFYVRDNGAGFKQEKAGRLFAPFQRLHSEKEYEGSGIGLASVKRIVHRHGGRIWAEGEVGKGATFYFTLGQ